MNISIIIPTYNRLTVLGRALDSVRCQTYQNYDLVVVDDGSTDGTSDWLATAYPEIRLIKLAHNCGAATARNVGIAATAGETIAFLDSDDVWQPDYLTKQVRSLNQSVLSYTHYFEGSSGRAIRTLAPGANPIRAMLLNNFIHSLSQVMVARWAIEQVGGFDERLLVLHDRELYTRLFTIGKPAHVNEPLVEKFWLSDGLVRQQQGEVWKQNGERFLEIFYSRSENACYLPMRDLVRQRFEQRVQTALTSFEQI